jgi:hypothetical protein
MIVREKMILGLSQEVSKKAQSIVSEKRQALQYGAK